jgi:3D (Asp-Asp-Asp) domain-containing protein
MGTSKNVFLAVSIFILFFSRAFAGPVNLYDGYGNPIGSTAGGLNINGSISATNPAVGPTGSSVPAQASYTAAKNNLGNLVGLLTGQQTMANSLACVLPSDQSAIPVTGTFWQATQPVSGTFWQATQPVSIASMPTTPVTGTFWQATQPVSATSLPLPTGAATAAGLTTINTTLGSPFQAGGSIGNTSFGISGTLPAFASTPTFNLGTLNGAATAALQTTGNTTLSTISGQLPATLGQKTMANSEAVVIASDQSAIPTKAPLSVTGSGSAASATVSTVATLTAPSNAVGFILQNLDTSTANIRWAVGRTATTTLGQQLQPGRDSGFVPIGANVSIVAESGTQNYDIQWVSQ